MQPMKTDPKPGVKTSEFWLVLSMQVVTSLQTMGHLSESEVVTIGSMLTSTSALVAYVISRYKAKKA